MSVTSVRTSRFAHAGENPIEATSSTSSLKVRDEASLDSSLAHPERPILIRRGTVVSMDASIGNFTGDVLLHEGKIVSVGKDLTHGPDTIVVDASGTIVMPGFVDSHLHAWQGQLRGIAPLVDFMAYRDLSHVRLAPRYRPHDAYVGTLMTSLQALDGGVTTIVDNSHNSRTYDHACAAVEGALDGGIRIVHASGAAVAGGTDIDWPAAVLRLRDDYFASDAQLATLRLFDITPEPAVWQFARDHGFWMSHEMGAGLVDNLSDFAKMGSLTEKHTFNHCFGTIDTDWRLIADAGAQVNVAPRSDAYYGLGPSFPPVDQALAVGIRPGLSMDSEISYGIDMFVEMQALLSGHRGRTFATQSAGGNAEHLTVQDVLEFATLGGAANAGLSGRVGALKPGMDADLILVRNDAFNTAPANNFLATLVGMANRSNVDTVFVAGRPVKWGGRLVRADLEGVRDAVEASRDYLLRSAGLELDRFADAGVTDRTGDTVDDSNPINS